MNLKVNWKSENSYRIIHSDDIITMDYVETRVNICVNDSNVIERIYIG